MPKAATLGRGLIAAFLVTTALSPAHAHDDPPRGDEDPAELSDRLSDPATQAKAALALSAISGALLAIDISPLARAMGTVDPYARDVPPGTTLGDIAGPHVRDMPRDIARRTPQAMGALSGMISSFEEMRPQLKAMGRQLKEQMRRSLPDE